MTKHTVLTRTTVIAALFVSLIGLGSCTKHVTQVVDQGFSVVYTIHAGDWKPDTYAPGPGNQEAVVLTVPEIDDKVVADGGVMVYLSFDGGLNYDALPVVENGVTYNTLHAKSTLYIGFSSVDGTTIPPDHLPDGDILAKVVILDATHLD